MSPKVLVVSNTALTTSNSNGRTLGLLLSGIEKEKLMQFCIKDEPVSSELIREAYCVSDTMVIKGMLKHKIASKKLCVFEDGHIVIGHQQQVSKTGFKFWGREIIWRIKLRSMDFWSRAVEFQPDIILFQLGNSGFLADLAYRLSKMCKAKLIVFTTEDYYFKEWNFIQPAQKSGAFDAYMKKYRKSIDRVLRNSSMCIANTPALAKKYAEEFGVQTDVVMAAASEKIETCCQKPENTVVYAGNLTLNRYRSIADIAKIVAETDPEAVVTVYGSTTPEMEEELKRFHNVSLNGFVKYDVLLPKLANAKLLLHCESFDDFYRKDLQAAFSTKIADSLASGVPLLLFAPANFSETEYLIKEKCAFVCTDSKELKDCVEKALHDEQARCSVVNRARCIANQNHNLHRNQQKMLDIIKSVCNT